MAEPIGMHLRSSVTALQGVGAERAEQLARLKITTVEELLLHRAHRYEDRRQARPIRELVLKEPTLVRGKVIALGVKYFRKRTRSLFELILDDDSARLHCQWWNQPYMENYFRQGDEVVAFGKAKSLKPRTMDHPETEVIEGGEELSIHLNRIVPIYPLTEGITQRWLRGLIWRTLPRFKGELGDRGAVPGLLSREEAIEAIHFPKELNDAEQARQRLAFDELFDLQLEMQKRRRNLQRNAEALPCAGDNGLIKPFLRDLGFTLTNAQARVLREIRADLGGEQPMRRLLQGDVGCGKTVVAACSALMAIESGFAVALMAPTEILAEQHHANFQRWFEPLSVRVELHTGSQKTMSGKAWTPSLFAPSQQHSSRLKPGLQTKTQARLFDQPLVIGTHALIEEAFGMDKLGLVIIDEQHKFGVSQREKLVRKGRYPHLLVMTATPIPRTLGLTLYGDLDSSVIDELPRNRAKIRTFVRSPESLPKVWEFIRGQLKHGRQAYVVYPRVEETDEGAVKAVRREFEKVQEGLRPFRVGLLHGRLRPEEKEAASEQFRAGETQVLLATSIIEVGIDVPNASVILIENAELFALAQLHQLRGRVGRGNFESYCVLVATPKTPEARQRLRALEQTTDGFKIAEMDLKLRGPGELLGQEQSGIPSFRFANLGEDIALIEKARDLALKA